MNIETKSSKGNVLSLQINFDDLVEDYAPQLIKAFKRRLSVLDELPKVADNIDEVVSTLRHSTTPEVAAGKLIQLLGIKPFTAERVLDMRLTKMTSLRPEDVVKEKEDLISEIKSML